MLTPLQVLEVWEEAVGSRLDERWVDRFLAAPEIEALRQASLSRLRAAATYVLQEHNRLKLEVWLEWVYAIQTVDGGAPRPDRRTPQNAKAAPQAGRTTPGRGGKSAREGEVWSPPVDGDLHKRVSEILKERRDYL